MTAVTRTPQQVQDSTGMTGVTEAHIATARGMVGLDVARDLGDDELLLRARDRRLIEKAVDWQAVYVKDHPDLLSREANLASASTNGNAVSWGPGGSGGAMLGPLAAMSLKRLSWRRSRSIPLRRARERAIPQTLTNDGIDTEWVPLR